MPATFDFTDEFAIVIGDDFSHEFVWEDANCDPLPLTGEFHAQIRKAGNLIATFVCTITGADSNIVRLELPSAVTNTLSPVKNASWDLEHHDPEVTTVLAGSVCIEKGVTET